MSAAITGCRYKKRYKDDGLFAVSSKQNGRLQVGKTAPAAGFWERVSCWVVANCCGGATAGRRHDRRREKTSLSSCPPSPSCTTRMVVAHGNLTKRHLWTTRARWRDRLTWKDGIAAAASFQARARESDAHLPREREKFPPRGCTASGMKIPVR